VNCLFISDLHLHDDRPELLQPALALLQYSAGNFDSIYLLGDLFEYWIGDDGKSACADRFASELKHLTDNQTAAFIMHGNRDFLIGEQYANACGATLIADDQYVLQLANTSVLLLHGDTLCSNDTDYNMYRKMVRNRHWRQDFLAKSIADRIATARAMRDTSKNKNRSGGDAIGDVTQETVNDIFQQFDVDHMIHGHTHRPNVHQHDIDGRSRERMVLGDWSADGAIVGVYDNETFHLQHWNGQQLSGL